MRDNYLYEDKDSSYILCHRSPERAERLRRIRRQPKRKLDMLELIRALSDLLVSLTIFAMPFWMILAGYAIERFWP